MLLTADHGNIEQMLIKKLGNRILHILQTGAFGLCLADNKNTIASGGGLSDLAAYYAELF